jgi:hypothetical protein
MSETDDSYIYTFGDRNNDSKLIIAWLPTSMDHLNGKWVDIPLNKRVAKAIPIVETNDYSDPGYVNTNEGTRIYLTGVPVVLLLD